MPVCHLGPEAAAFANSFSGEVRNVRRDASDQDCAEREAGRVGSERQRNSDREQEGPDRWAQQLVGEQERAGQASVGDPEVLAWHEARDEAVAADIGEDLGRPEDEECQQDDGDADGAADHQCGEDREDRRPNQVHRGDDSASIVAVRNRSGGQAEQQVRELLGEERHRDEEGVARQ